MGGLGVCGIIILFYLGYASGQMTCTSTGVSYVTTSSVGYYSDPYADGYSCGVFWWSRCTRTLYRSRTRAVYAQSSVYHLTCCTGYSGSGCQAVCSPNCQNGGTCSSPNVCSCQIGWSGQSCTIDADECSVENGGCHHTCHNTAGSFECRCNSGYSLASDGRTCNEPPSVPRNVRVSSVGQRSATVSWDPPNNTFPNPLTSVSAYRVTASQSQFQEGNRFASEDEHSGTHQFTDLEEHTLYSFSVAASNAFGYGVASEPEDATTLQAAPSAAPLWVEVLSNCSYNITIQWSPPPEIDRNGVILYYQINVTETETGAEFTWTSSETNTTRDFLHPHYHYECRVAASTVVGIGPYSTVETVQTLPAAPTTAPSHVRVTSFDSTNISLVWEPPPFSDRNGDIVMYHIMVTEQESQTVSEYMTTSENYTLTNLHPHYNYNISIAAETVQVGPFTSGLFQQTMESVPSSAPGNFSVVATNATSLLLSWSELPLPDMNGIILEYTVHLTNVRTGEDTEYSAVTDPYAITNLHPDYTYRGKLAAVTVVGAGPFSSPLEVRLPEAAPSGTPTNFSVEEVLSRLVTLSWQHPLEEERNGIITGFIIQLGRSNTNNITLLETGNMTVSINEGLKPFTQYFCKVAALTMAGVGPYTEAIYFTTLEDVPSPVDMIVMMVVLGTPTHLTIQWNRPVEPNGELLAYSVYCGVSGQQPLCDCDFGNTSPSCPRGDMSLNVTYHQQAVLPVALSQTEVIGGFLPYTNYTCFMTANTSAGESAPGIPLSSVTDESRPEDPPQNVTILVISATVLHLSWRQPSTPNGVIVAYHITYNVSALEERTLDTSGTNLTVTDLDEYTAYKFSLYASTRIGDGPFTIILGRTNESYPHSPPRDVQLLNVGKRCADVSWIPPLIQDHNGPLTHYEIEFIQSQHDSVPNVTITSNDLSVSYSDLEEFTNYAVVVVASTSTGLGPFSSPVTFTTQEDAPSSAPLLGAGYAHSSSVVTFNWTAPLPIDQNGVIDYYNVIVTEVPSGREWFLVAIDTEITLASLHPYYNYSCVVAAYTVDIGPFSQPFFILTGEEAPTAPPSRSQIVSYSSTSISLTWEPPPADHINGILRYYTVVYTEQDTSLEFSVTSNITSLQLMGLHPYFTYVIKVRAETVSPGPLSDSQSVQLQEDAPSASVLNLSAQAVDSKTIFISWIPPLFIHQNGMIRSYTVSVNETNTGIVYNYSSLTTNVTVSQLHPYYTYSCAVSPVTVKPGPLSSPVYVTTHQDVPSGTVQDIEILELHSQMVILQWEPPEIAHQNGLITLYHVNILAITLNDSLQLTFSNATGEVSNLSPYTNYQIGIATATVVGVGPLSPPFNIRTEEDAPSSPPMDVEAVSLNSYTLSISWSSPPPEHTNGVVRGYTVTLFETDTLDSITNTTNQTSITLSSLIPSFTYVYTVAATTIELGPASPEMNITMPEDAPSGLPTNITAEIVRPNSVTLTWSPPGKRARNGIITGYIVNYVPFVSDNSSSLLTDTQRIDIVNLNPHTLYSFSVAARTAVGIGPFSTHLHVRTEETAPSSPPTNVTANTIDSTTVALSWVAPPPADHNGIIRYYAVNLTETDTGVQFQIESETTAKFILSLHPSYTYDVVVAAVTIAIGPYSLSVTFGLPEDAPSGPPTNFNVEALSSNSLQATWNPPLQEQQNGAITYYAVTATNLNDGVEREDVVSNTSLTVFSLEPHTEYEVYVLAATTAGTGPPTSPLIVHTHEDSPTHGPTNLTVVDIGPTHIRFRWDHPPNDTHQGIVRLYNIYVDVEETEQTYFYTTTADNTELLLAHLHPYYTYHMRVAAVTVEEGNSTFLSAKTEESAPSGPPQNFEVSIFNSTSTNITWSSPVEEDTNGIIRHFVINITQDTGEVQLVTLSSQHLYHIARDLQPYTNYSISVAAVTVDIGPFSSEITVEVPESAPILPPANISILILSPRQIFVLWTPPEKNARNGVIRMYIVNVTSNEIYSETSDTSNITLTVLPFRHYHISVAAVTVETGPFSENVAVETPEDSPTAAPQHLEVSNVTSTTLTLTWAEPDTEFHNGIIRHYTVVALPLTLEIESVSVTTSKEEVEILGLHPFTTYSISIAAFTVGLGPSESINATTMESLPSGAATSVAVELINSTAIYANWQPPLDVHKNGIILNYVVNISQIGSTLTNMYLEFSEQLTFGNLQPFSLYAISVAVKNSVGVGPFSVPELVQTLEDAPSSPRYLRVSNVTSTSAHLWWDDPPPEDHNGIIRSYEIHVAENETGLVYHFTATDMQYMVESLHPAYWYSVQVQAVTVQAGEPSEELIFKTLEDIPSYPPLNLSVYVQNSTHAIVMWEDPDQDQHNGVITDYRVKLIETDTLNTFPILTVILMPLMLPDLHPFYTYQVQVAAATSVGVGPYTQLFAFRMDEAAPSSPPQNATVEPASSTAILISWEPPAIGDQNGHIRSYNIVVADTVSQTQRMYTVGSEHTQLLVDMLQPHRSYESSVAATTVATGVFSHPVIATTNQDVPSEAPSGVSGWAVNSTSLYVTWSPLQEDSQNGIIVHYSLRLTELASGRVITTERNATSVVVSSLHPHYAYKVTVAAATIIGTGPFSLGILVLTYSDVPTGAPVNVEIESISSTSVTVSWGEPSLVEQNGVILAYFVSVVKDNEQLNVTTNFTAAYISRILISPLRPFSKHNLSVAAMNINGTGPYSAPIPFTTAQAAPGAPPVGLRAENVSSRALSLIWEPPPLSSHNGVIQEFRVYVLENNTNTETHYNSLSTEMTLNNLHPYYNYLISVAAVTIDIGPYETIGITTLEEAPSGPPQQLQVLSVTSTDVTLSWLPPSLQQQNGVIRNYTVNVCHPKTDNCWSELSGNTQYTVSELHPFYTYHINVVAITVDSGPPTGYKSVTCLEDVPSGPPTNVTVEALSSSSLHMMWSEPEPESTNGIIREYEVIVRVLQNGSSSLMYSVVDNELIIQFLTPYSDYECLVAAVTVKRGPHSTPVSAQTFQDAPYGPPLNVSIEILSSSSVNISWSPPIQHLQNGIIQEYILSIWIGDSTTTKHTNISYAIIEYLHPHYTYSVAVAAITVASGPFSIATKFTMPQDAPSSGPQNVEAVSLSPYNIELHWEPPHIEDQNGNIASYYISVTHISTGEEQSFQTSGDSFFFSGNNFHPYYTYNITIYAATIGIGPGTSVILTTMETAPSSPPLNVSAEPISPTVAQLTWQPPDPENRNGRVREYSIIRVTLPTGDLHELMTSNSEMVLEDLHPYTNYFVIIAAKTVYLGPFSPQEFINMPEAAPSAPVQIISLRVLSATSVGVRWLPPPIGSWNGIIRNYTINVDHVESVHPAENISLEMHNLSFTQVHPSRDNPLSNSGDPHLVSLPLLLESVIIGNLQESQVYQFSIAMANSAGWGEESLPIIQELPGSEPSGPPDSIQVRVLSSSSVEVHWEPPSFIHHNGIIIGYWVEVTHGMTPPQSVFNETTDKLTIVVDGLEGFTDYYITITAENSDGRGPSSIPIHFKTLEDVPSVPVNVTVRQVGITSVSISWGVPEQPNGVITHYIVWYAPALDKNDEMVNNTITVDAQHTLLIVENLTVGFSYIFKVRAETTAGFGIYSKGMTITLDPNYLVRVEEIFSQSQLEDNGAIIVASLVALGGWILAVISIATVFCMCYVCHKKNIPVYQIRYFNQHTEENIYDEINMQSETDKNQEANFGGASGTTCEKTTAL